MLDKESRVAAIGCAGIAAALLCLALPGVAAAEELTLWHHTYPPATDFIKQKAVEYNKLHPDVTITVQDDPHGDYEIKLLAAIASGNPPDIINLLDYLYPSYVKKKLLAPVDVHAFGVQSDDQLQAMYMPQALSGLTVGGTTFGVPEEFNTLALFLNKAHFAEAGLDATSSATWPRTWNDLFTLAAKLTKKDDSGKITRLGFNWVWGLDPYWYAQQYWPILVQYGCQVVDASNQVTINAPPCVKAFTETWQRLITDKIGGPDYATVNPVNALQDFSDGRQSMMIAGIWAPPLFGEQVKKDYIVAPLPQLDPAQPHTLLNSYSLTVTSGSKHQQLAWDFIHFLVSDANGYLRATGYVTGVKGWADTEAAKATRGSAIFAEGQKYGSFVWRSPTWTEEGTAIKNAIEQFAQGSPVKDALDQAAAAIKDIRAQQ